MANILIATLGESPIVVTAMYHKLLAEGEVSEIERVVVLCPVGERVLQSSELVIDALKHIGVKGEEKNLSFEDTNDETSTFEFLSILASTLQECELNGDHVYLSLAGGRKNMSAIMALVVPLFPCVVGLYHILDPKEVAFVELQELWDNYDLASLKRKIQEPDVKELQLVKFPFKDQQRVSEYFRSLVFSLNDQEHVEELWEKYPEEAEAVAFTQEVLKEKGGVIDIWLTENVKNDYRTMLKKDANSANRFRMCFDQMKYRTGLMGGMKPHTGLPDPFHFYKRTNTERPLFYITKRDRDKIYQIVIVGLIIKRAGKYPPVSQLIKLPIEPGVHIEQIIEAVSDSVTTVPCQLLIPMGTTPMIATQFYELRRRAGCTIQKVVLLYPGGSQGVINAVKRVREVFDEIGVQYSEEKVDIEDVSSTDDCTKYLEELVRVIKKMQQQGAQVELALSGGRKGMAALAMFAAQQTGLCYVYHMLIEGRDLYNRVERETSVKALQAETRRVRRERLLLRAYEDHRDKFRLFRVPVLPAGR